MKRAMLEAMRSGVITASFVNTPVSHTVNGQPGSVNYRAGRKVCRDCGHPKPVSHFHRTPSGRCKCRCIPCEQKRQATTIAYHKAYHVGVKARKAALRDKWLAFAKGDTKSVDWGKGR